MLNSLRTRLTLTFILLAIIPIIVLGGALAQTTYNANKTEAIALQSQVAQNASAKVADYFQAMNQSMFGLGEQLQGLSTLDPAIYSSLMLNELNFGVSGNNLDELILLNPQGQEIFRANHQGPVTNNPNLDHSKLDEYIQPLRTRQAYYGPASIDPITGKPYFILSIPLYAPDTGRTTRLSGVLIGKVRLDPVDALLAESRSSEGQTIYMTDSSGKVFAHQSPSFNLQNAHIALPTDAAIQSGLSNPSVVLAINKIQFGTQTFNVVVEQPTAIAFSLINNLIRILSINMLITLLVSILIGFIVVRQIVLPIENLAMTAEKIAAGDLSQTTSIRSRDEIGTLANAFNNMTSQLRSLVGSLEQRVAERTEELERQALRMRASAEVARDAASAPSLDELLDRSSKLIRDRFGFYHTGIFLLDDKKEYAVLRSSPTEAGAKMLENNHRLRVGEQGIVGQVAGSGEPRIALDVGTDAIYFNNPLLPNTHSEMALPLKTAEGVLGILDVQSDQVSAFKQDDIAIMQVMADQLATAIERIRLFQQAQFQLKEIEETYGRFTRESWKGLSQGGQRVSGYKFDNIRLQPINQPPAPNGQFAAVPIQLRGQTIGIINVRFQQEQAQDKTIALIKQISERLATALENARLLEETRQRAERDALVNELTGHFRSTLDLESVLQTAAQEMQKVFHLQEAEVRLNMPVTNEPEKTVQEKSRKNGRRHE